MRLHRRLMHGALAIRKATEISSSATPRHVGVVLHYQLPGLIISVVIVLVSRQSHLAPPV